MTQPMPTRGPRILLGVVFTALVLLASLPFAVEVAVPFWLARQGFEQPWIDDVDFNPFTGVAEVRGLYAARDGQPLLALKHLRLMVDWQPLWERRVYLRQLLVEGLELDIRQASGGPLSVAGFEIPDAGDTSEPGETPAPAWRIGIDRLDISASRVNLDTPPLTGALRLNDVHLNGLAQWRPDRPVDLVLEGHFNEGAVALKGEIVPFSDLPSVRLRANIDALDLSGFASLARPTLQRLAGKLHTDTTIALRYSQQGLEIEQSGAIQWQGLDLKTAAIELRDPVLSWNGKLQATLRAQGSVQVQLGGSLVARRLRLQAPGPLSLESGIRLDSRKVDLTLSDAGPVLAHDGDLDLSGFTLSLPQGKLSEPALHWSGQVAMDADGALRIGGHLKNQAAKAELAESAVAGIDRLATVVTIDSKLRLQSGPNGRVGLDQDGSLALTDLDLAVGEFELSHKRLAWDGKTALSQTGADASDIDLKGSLSAEELLAKGPGIRWSNGLLDWRGRLAMGGGDEPRLESDGDLRLEKVSVNESKQVLKTVDLEQLRIEGLQLVSQDRAKAREVALDRLFLREIDTGEQATDGVRQALAQFGGVRLSGVDLASQQALQVDRFVLKDSQLMLRRTAGGGLYGLDFAAAGDAAASPEETRPAATPAAQAPLHLRLGELALEGDTRIRIQDEAVTPRYAEEIRIDRLTVKDLDSANPDHPSPVELLARLGEYSRIEAKGTVQPFAERLTLNLQLDAEAIDLHPFSAYSAPLLGYALSSGQLAAQVKLSSKAGILDGDTHVTLNQLEVKAENDAKMEGLQKKLDMPLEAGLALLKDKNDVIELDLPIKGDMDSPDVDIGDVINTALGKAMKTAALGALTYAIQPYGAILAIVQLADGAGSAVKLEPIAFSAGSGELEKKGRDYTAKLAGLLADRPGTKLRLCGYAVEADRQALIDAVLQNSRGPQPPAATAPATPAEAERKAPPPPKIEISDEQLRALARGRGDRVRSLLVKENAVEAKRIIMCRPQIDNAADGAPRVDLLL